MSDSWKFIAVFAAIAIATVACRGADDPAPAVETKPGQHVGKFEKQTTLKLDYLLYLPPDYNKQADKKWPLILFLHGSGERGANVNSVKQHGPPKLVESEPASALATQFVVLSPQCPEGKWWNSDNLIALLDDIQVKYRIDADRVYLTGLSMGGFGTWDLASTYPERFAAIAPMCGGGNPSTARRMQNLAIWVFHGTADTAVPVKRSEEMVEALQSIRADVKFSKYPGVQHDCWTQSYANPELYAWFLSHKRFAKSTNAPAAK